MARRKKPSAKVRAARRRAALKGWRTRRKTARTRSLAAKKGHETRRRREAAKVPKRKGVSLVDERHPQGRFAFLAKDQRPDIADVRAGRRPDALISANVTFAYTDSRTGETRDESRVIHFEAGENEDEFFDNYHDAVREELDDVIDETESETGGQYERFSVLVSRLA